MDLRAAASAMGKRSAAVRRERWGEQALRRRLREWGQVGWHGTGQEARHPLSTSPREDDGIVLVHASCLGHQHDKSVQRVSGYAQKGGATVTVGANTTTVSYQESFPNCTVAVYDTGTINLSVIYEDNGVTLKANPFTAASDGLWTFYAANGRYDVRFYGTGITAPFTISDVLLQDGVGTWSYSAVPFSATPSFDCNVAEIFALTLTGNVTSSTVTHASTGKFLILRLAQDGTGGHTFAWPADFLRPPTMPSAANACIVAAFFYDGTNWRQFAATADALSASTILASGQITSTVATGTAPLVIASTTVVANLNADQVDGKNASDFLLAANNLSEVTAATARTNLGLGDSATKNVGTGAGTVAAGDDSRIAGAQQASAKNQANGYAGLDGSSKLTGSQQVYGTTANTAAQGNDSRITTRQSGFMLGADTASAVIADTDDQQTIWRAPAAVTISSVWAETDSATALTMQLQKDDGSPADMFSSNLSVTNSGATASSFVPGENVLASGDRLDLKIVSAGGGAKRLTVFWTWSYN